MKHIIILLLILTSFASTKAQNDLSFIEVDTASYRAYINSNWDRIIEIGNQGLENNVDYYYLRIRMAYAYYMKKQYRSAIPHYKEALLLSANNALALEYLYRCYTYSGQYNSAEKLLKKFPNSLKESIGKEDSKIINKLSFYASFASGADTKLKEEITNSISIDEDGVQVLTNGYKNYNLNLSHRFNRSIIAHHSANLLYKDSYSTAVVNGLSYISGSQIVRQINYNLVLDITPIQGFTVSPLFSYLNYKVPVFYEYGSGSDNDREVASYLKYKEYLIGIKGTTHLKYTNISLAYTFSNINNAKQNTIAGSLSVFPLSNLSLYYTINTYLHLQNNNTTQLNQFIHSHTIGAKILTNLWIEAFATFGEFSNFYDAFSTLSYNSLEKYNFIAGANIIVPLFKPKLSFFLSYRFNQSESVFVSKNNSLDYSNSKDFNYQSITGGISWTL